MPEKTDEQSANEGNITPYEEAPGKQEPPKKIELKCEQCKQYHAELARMLRENAVLAALLQVTCIPFDEKYPDLIDKLKALCAEGKNDG